MRKLKLPFFIALSVLILASVLVLGSLKNSTALISPQAYFSKNTPTPTTPLQKVVAKALEGTKGDYGIVIKNMKTGESYYSNPDKVFEPGSLYKLWVMATVYDKIAKGEIKEDEILSQDIAVLNEKFGIPEDAAEFTEGTITLSVRTALNQMIVISHNYAALLLTERVKNSQLQEYLQNNGIKNSHIGNPPKTTPYDIALFLEKMYKGELINSEYSQKMIDLLKKQQLNNGIPKYLPDHKKVANKTGEIGWFKHDAGIVFTDQGDYIIVIMSRSNSPLGAQERIALVSKAVYDYFTKE